MGTYGSAWQTGGYSGSGNVEPLIGSLQGKTAIIAGNAVGVFGEVDTVLALHPDAIVFAVNDVGMYLPRVDHWVSLHADNLGVWKAVRWLTHHQMEAAKYHSVTARPVVDFLWEGLTPCFALSGYFAMQIAYILGAREIILCGCPGSPVRRFFEARLREDGFGYGGGLKGSDKGIREQLEKEMERVPELRKKVRSTSGFTRTFFGGLT